MRDIEKCEEVIKHFAGKESTFKTVAQKMQIIKEVIRILKVPFEITKSLQIADYTLSDFYGSCIMMRERLKMLMNKQDKRTDLATCLLDEFDKRRTKILRNQAMLAAVYLDRRYSAEMEEREIELAKLSLWNLYDRLKNSRAINKNTETHEEPEELNVDDERFDFEAYFKSKGLVTVGADGLQHEQTHTTRTEMSSADTEDSSIKTDYTKSKAEFLLLLDDFEKIFPLTHHNKPILTFWEEQKRNFPELYEVAIIVFAIPPSQATVERSFSQFGFVFNCRRCRISSELLEAILLIKLNKDIAYDVFENDLAILEDDLESKKEAL